MSYIIETTIEGVPYGLKPVKGKFKLIPINSQADSERVMSLPQLSLARSILTWINNNDKKLSKLDLKISAQAKYG